MRNKIVKNKRRLKKPVVNLIDTSDIVKAYDKVKLFYDRAFHHRKIAQGVASNQVGLDYRIFTALIGGKWQLFINPEYISKEGEEIIFPEGCLSIKKKTVKVPRSYLVNLRYTVIKSGLHGLKFDTIEKQFSGSDARVIQHEMDHLDGILITDYQA